MNIQYIIVIAIIAAACLYAASLLRKRSRSFTAKPGCGDDCGCNAPAKKLIS